MFKKKTEKKDFLTLPVSGAQIRRDEVDNICYMAFNAGGIAGWSDRILASKREYGKKVYEHIGLGGSILIRDMIDDRICLLNAKNLLKAVDDYIRGARNAIEDGRFADPVTIEDANRIIQLAIFGEVKHR